jgi:hypothetical protein
MESFFPVTNISSGLLILKFAAPREESGFYSEGRASTRPNRSFSEVGFTGCGKLLRLVGRAFRHDIKSAFSSGVLTPEGPKTHFSATCLAAEADFSCGSAALCPEIIPDNHFVGVS